MPLAAGHHLGPYEILSPLGKGGMGEVYKARDTRLAREVALKILPPEFTNDRPRRDRFETEAKAVAALNHPNIVALHDIGESDGVAFTISELIDGDTLRNLQLPLKKAIEIAAQIADGLAAAHAKGITHRDLKPDNVMLTRDGRAKILDFGLAQITDKAGDTTQTAAGAVMGTAAYMSPEQVRGELLDTRSDIFSFGVLLYELLTNKKAFDADTHVESMNAILKEDPPELPGTIPAPIGDLLRACLEKSKDQRFQSAKDLAIALRALNNRSLNTTESLPPLKPARKRAAFWIAAATLLLGAAGGFRLSQSFNDEFEPLRITPLTFGPASKRNPAFSPDGRSIAYQQNFEGITEIVVQTPGATRPVVLARGAGIGFPQWTADGTRVCYIGTGDLWCVGSAGGTPQRVIERIGPVLSIARGTGAAYFIRTEKGVSKIFVSDPLGSAPRALDHAALPGLSGQVFSAAVSADGTQFVLLAQSAASIISLTPGGQGPRRIHGGVIVGAAKWLPGGHDLAIAESRASQSAGSRIFTIAAQGQHRRLVLSDSGAIISFDVSPDGNRIAYSHGHPDWNLVEYSITGKRLREHGPGFQGRWSPSGDRIVLNLLSPAAVVIRSGAGVDTLIRNGEGVGRFSPDGTRVAVNGSIPPATFVYPAAGGRPVPVHSGSAGSPCWSPDGESLWLNEKGSAIKVPSQGGQAVPVLEGSVFACSPDGSVAYAAAGAVNLLAPDGKTSRKLTAIRGFLTQAAFGDGGRVLYLLRSSGRAIAVIDTRTAEIGPDINVEIAPADNIIGMSLHPDGKRMLLTTGNVRYNISIAEGFAQPETGWRSWFRHWRILPPPPEQPEPE